MSLAQVETVMNHLNMVFIHEIDPSFGGPVEQAKLDEAHKGNPAHAQRQDPTYPPYDANKLVMKC